MVGTGGASHYAESARRSGSEVFDGSAFGILKLVLGAAGYTWEFVPVLGASFRDSGSGDCHAKPKRKIP